MALILIDATVVEHATLRITHCGDEVTHIVDLDRVKIERADAIVVTALYDVDTDGVMTRTALGLGVAGQYAPIAISLPLIAIGDLGLCHFRLCYGEDAIVILRVARLPIGGKLRVVVGIVGIVGACCKRHAREQQQKSEAQVTDVIFRHIYIHIIKEGLIGLA